MDTPYTCRDVVILKQMVVLKLVVISIEKIERDGHPLHMSRCGHLKGRSNKLVYKNDTLRDVEI